MFSAFMSQLLFGQAASLKNACVNSTIYELQGSLQVDANEILSVDMVCGLVPARYFLVQVIEGVAGRE